MLVTYRAERLSNAFFRLHHFFHQYCIFCGQCVGSICLLKFMYIKKHSKMKRWKFSTLLNLCYKIMAYFVTPNNANSTPTPRKWNHRVYDSNLPSPIKTLTMTTVVPSQLIAKCCKFCPKNWGSKFLHNIANFEYCSLHSNNTVQ